MSGNRVVFEKGAWWLGVFLIVVTVQTVAVNVVASVWDLGPDIPVLEANALAVLLELALVGGVWWFVRKEGVAFAEIGLSARLVAPAVGIVTGFYLALNVLGIGFGMLVAGPAVVGYQWTVPPIDAVLQFFYYLVVAAIVEELTFRGYVQSKVVALVGGDTRVGIGIGIVIASALFVGIHVPRVVTSGVPGTQSVVGYGSILFLSAFGYGILYELTQNLYIPILVHAAGNVPGTLGIVFFDVGGFPGWAGVAYPFAYLALFGVVIAGYRRWAFGTGQLPVWTARSAMRNEASS